MVNYHTLAFIETEALRATQGHVSPHTPVSLVSLYGSGLHIYAWRAKVGNITVRSVLGKVVVELSEKHRKTAHVNRFSKRTFVKDKKWRYSPFLSLFGKE